ncbi:tetratricopeptide repeat protein, partial [Fulvivirga aurantia]|uniref:tetratricopeptide repeat protein n=1 Tax=Fulvivirga aurantia TaxID=2529383 RepID=UPI0016268FB6
MSQSEPTRLYLKGLELIDKNNFTAARETFEEYLQMASDGVRKADAQYYKAYAALSLYHEDGEKLVESFIRENENHPKAALAYYELGNFYFKDKKYNKATEYLSKVRLSLIGKEKRNETRFKLGYAHFAQREFDEAITFFNALKDQSGKYEPAANYYAGYIAYEQGNLDAAVKDLKKAEQDDAYKSVVPAMLADLYYKQGRYDELLAYSDKVLNGGTRVNQGDFYLLAAEAHTQKGNYDRAVAFYDKYVEGIQNPPIEVHYRVGYANFKAGNNDKAITHLKQAASTTDEIGTYASYYLGIAYLKEGNKIYAITAFDNARRTDVNSELSEESAYQYAKLSYDLDRVEESIAGARAFLERYPKSKHVEEVGDILSDAYLNTNNYNLAIEYIEGVPNPNVRQQEVCQKATFLKGMELFNKGEYRNAIGLFDKSLKFDHSKKYRAMAGLWAGEAYSVGKRYEQAIPYYQKALWTGIDKSDESILKTRYGLGYAYYNTKQYSKAREQFSEYIRNSSQGEAGDFYDDALLRLADTHYVSKNYNEALSFYQRAIKTNSVDNDYARLQAGTVLGIQGSTEAAIEQFNYIITNYGQSRYLDDALFQKAQLNFEKGNYEEAVKNFTALIQRKPSSQFVPYAYMRRASSNYNLKAYDKSINDYVKVLDKYNTHSVAEEALLPLQEVLNLQGRSSEFNGYLSSYKQANPDKKGLESVEFETAKNQYFNLAYEKSISSFKSFIQDYPNSGKRSEAKYYIAESYYRLNENENALEYYNELLASGSFEPMSKIINRIGELEFENGRYENATYFYYKLVDAARTKKEQYYAWAGLMESYFNLKKYDSVAHYANIILEKGNVNISSQNKASLYLGKAAYARGDYEVAKDEFLNTLNTAKDVHGAEAQYMLGLLFYNNKEHQKSIEALI